MRTATKFVAPLTDEERLRLKEIHKTDPNWRTSMRAQAILLSEKVNRPGFVGDSKS